MSEAMTETESQEPPFFRDSRNKGKSTIKFFHGAKKCRNLDAIKNFRLQKREKEDIEREISS